MGQLASLVFHVQAPTCCLASCRPFVGTLWRRSSSFSPYPSCLPLVARRRLAAPAEARKFAQAQLISTLGPRASLKPAAVRLPPCVFRAAALGGPDLPPVAAALGGPRVFCFPCRCSGRDVDMVWMTWTWDVPATSRERPRRQAAGLRRARAPPGK